MRIWPDLQDSQGEPCYFPAVKKQQLAIKGVSGHILVAGSIKVGLGKLKVLRHINNMIFFNILKIPFV